MTKHLIASGILTWEGQERRSDRYGSVHMTADPYNGPSDGEASVFYDKERLASLEGQKVRLTCKVTATRQSGHAGDLTHGIMPSAPELGAEICLGVGTLRHPAGWDGQPDIVLEPGDGRRVFWIDPRILYQLHDQTVEVYAEVTADDFTPAPKMTHDGTAHAYDNGDGTIQVKNVNQGERVRILPNIERLGPGMFMVDNSSVPGRRHRVIR